MNSYVAAKASRFYSVRSCFQLPLYFHWLIVGQVMLFQPFSGNSFQGLSAKAKPRFFNSHLVNGIFEATECARTV